MSISLLLEMASSSNPDRTALVSGEMRLTTTELSALADGGAGVIAASGAKHVAYVGTGGIMLPLLLFELMWKAIWLVAFALPRWLDGTLDEGMRTTLFETSFGLVLIFVIPWRYVGAHYLARPGDPWTFRRQGNGEAPVRTGS